ncbi:MAG: DUF5683 domain-containing protein [Bacteroidales bacterium]|nr:DUF5683 domain-containing protein [Bacteroidales bacterium]
MSYLRIIGWNILLIFVFLFCANAQDTIPQIPDSQIIKSENKNANSSDTLLNLPDSVAKKDNKTTKSKKTTSDSTDIQPQVHSPRTAGWLSAALPGLGQGYNRKYWKIPIVYVGFGGVGTVIYYYGQKFVMYRDELRYRINHSDSANRFANEPRVNVEFNKQYYQRSMEYAILGAVVWYLLNIVDAVVDAHLLSFDISDNLALSVMPLTKSYSPLAFNSQIPFGITFMLNF